MKLRDECDLISRLFSYSPTEGRTPLEDYCTEALAWCLNYSHELRDHFFDLLRIADQSVRTIPVSLETQYAFRSLQILNTGADIPYDPAGRIDMLISPEVGQDFLILIESKFDAVLGAPQLEKYRAWLRAKKVEGYVNCVLVTITVLEVSATADVDIRIRWADVQRMLENCPIADRAVSMIAKSFAKFLKERGISPMHIARVAYDLLGSARSYLELVNQIEDILNHFRNQGSPGYLLPKLTKIQTNEDTAAWRGIYSQSRTYYVGFGISLIGDPAMFLWAEFTVEGNRANLVEQFPEELKRYHCQGREWIRKIELAEGRTSEPPSFDGKNTFFVFLADTSGKLNGNAQLMLDWFNSVSQQMFQLLGTSFKP